MASLIIGDVFWTQHGPFIAECVVVGVTDAGAELEYTGRTELIGYPGRLTAPDGSALTTDPAHGFLGRAHWASVEDYKPLVVSGIDDGDGAVTPGRWRDHI